VRIDASETAYRLLDQRNLRDAGCLPQRAAQRPPAAARCNQSSPALVALGMSLKAYAESKGATVIVADMAPGKLLTRLGMDLSSRRLAGRWNDGW
jgi:hypothetical protein